MARIRMVKEWEINGFLFAKGKHALAQCGMQMSISADGEKKGDSSASFDVRSDLFVW